MLENNEGWQEFAMAYLQVVANQEETFTIESVRAYCAAFDDIQPKHQNAWGALFRKASQLGIIKHVGYRKSQRPASHGRVVAVWRKA